MMATRKSDIFHQMARCFQAPNSAISRQLAGPSTTAWRTDPRLMGVGKEKSHARFDLWRKLQSAETTRSDTVAQDQHPNQQERVQDRPDLRITAHRNVDLTGRGSNSMATFRGTNETALAPPSPVLRQGALYYRDSPILPDRLSTDTTIHHQTVNRNGTPDVPRNSGSVAADTPHPSANIRRYRRDETIASPPSTLPSFGLNKLSSGSTRPLARSRNYDLTLSGVGDARSGDAASRRTWTMSEGKARTAGKDSSASRKIQSGGVSFVQKGPLEAHAANNSASGTSDLVSSGAGLIQSDGHTNPGTMTSGGIGEIWLDTSSLRDWLHAFLAGEIERASRAANGPS
jgi:hypothetical protein